VEADAGDADLLLVGNHAADGLRITQMTVRADHAGNRVANRHAVAHLRDRRAVMLAEHLEWAVLVLRRLRLDCDIRSDSLRFARELLLAGGIAERAPQRHRTLTG